MAERSAISWTTSTFNSWIGCTKVGPGCDHCYAETLDKRHRWGGDTHWGDDKPRHRTSANYWKQPLLWNKKAAAGEKPWRVFCASLADVFDNKVPDQWRRDLFDVIEMTPHLQWLLVTKRIGNVFRMGAKARSHDWLAAQRNVRLLITVVNQEEADRDIPKLLALNCKNGISYEPALGPVDWSRYLCPWNHGESRYGNRVEWIIVGGESTQGAGKARPFDVQWALNTVAQGKAAGVPVFVKQLGSNAFRDLTIEEKGNVKGDRVPDTELETWLKRVVLKDRAGADPAEWAEALRVQEFPA